MSELITSGDLWSAIGRAVAGAIVTMALALYLVYRSLRHQDALGRAKTEELDKSVAMNRERIEDLEQRTERMETMARETHSIVQRMDESAGRQTDALHAVQTAVMQMSSAVSALHVSASKPHPEAATSIEELRAEVRSLSDRVDDIRHRLGTFQGLPPGRGKPN